MFPRHSILAAALPLLALILGIGLPLSARAAGRPDCVDLTEQQSPIRNQGGRSCSYHSSTAAMEAAIKRAGYGDVALSSDTFMFFTRLFGLGDAGKSADGAENTPGGWGGGNGVGNLRALSRGLAIPEDAASWADGHDYKVPQFPDKDPHWTKQFNVDSWNLSPRQLQPRTLWSRRFFTVTSYSKIPDAKSIDAIEAALAGGHEVVWDFACGGKRPGDAMWTYDGPAKPDCDYHSMLIVGYDRRGGHPPYFIVKNSWGPTKVPGANGFTRISYDFLKYGSTAGYITGIAERSWPALRFIGRWSLHFDGMEGILDITHVPGVARASLEDRGDKRPDRRIGDFYDRNDPARPYRVNGSIAGNRIDFYIDGKMHNASWDRLGGRHFTYYLNIGDRELMAGSFTDPDGTTHAGYARRLQSDDAFPLDAHKINVGGLPEMWCIRPAERLPDKLSIDSYLGAWKLQARETVPLRLTKRDDSVVPADKQSAWAGLTGNGIVALVNKSDPTQCEVTIRTTIAKAEKGRSTTTYHFTGRLLSHERGVVAGLLTTSGTAKNKAVYGATLVH